MTKSELIQEIAKSSGETLATTERIFNQLFATIQAKLAVGETVEIKNFGKFKVVDRQERIGRNPKTGEEMKIPAHKAPHFTASGILKKAIN